MGSLTGAVVFNIVAKYIQYRSLIVILTFDIPFFFTFNGKDRKGTYKEMRIVYIIYINYQ